MIEPTTNSSVRWQFSLRSLFIFSALASVYCAAFVWSPSFLGFYLVPIASFLATAILASRWWGLYPVWAISLGIASGTVCTSLNLGVSGWVLGTFMAPPADGVWMFTGIDAFVIPAIIGIAWGFVLSCGLAILYTLAVIIWFLAFDRYYVDPQNGG